VTVTVTRAASLAVTVRAARHPAGLGRRTWSLSPAPSPCRVGLRKDDGQAGLNRLLASLAAGGPPGGRCGRSSLPLSDSASLSPIRRAGPETLAVTAIQVSSRDQNQHLFMHGWQCNDIPALRELSRARITATVTVRCDSLSERRRRRGGRPDRRRRRRLLCVRGGPDSKRVQNQHDEETSIQVRFRYSHPNLI
jgi:hypothetical protein